MPDLQVLYIRQRKILFYLLSIYVIGWGFTAYQSIFLGLVFGTSLSLFNLWLMVKKTNQFGERVLQGQKVRSLGSFSRMATGALAVVVALRYPDYLQLMSVIIGLMTSYIVIMIDLLVYSLKNLHK